MTNCSDTARVVYSTNDIIQAYPDVITNLYSILDIAIPCQTSTECPCTTFLFELNFLYYLYTLNECLLNSGSINNSSFTNINQEIIFSVETPGNLDNSTITENQTQNATVTTMNINDKNNQNQLGAFYYIIYNNLQKAFQSEGIQINTSLKNNTDISKETFTAALKESVDSLTITDTMLKVTVTDTVFKSLTANLNQSTTISILSEELANNALSTFFNKQMNVIIPQACQELPQQSSSDSSDSSSDNSSSSSSSSPSTSSSASNGTSSSSSSSDNDHYKNVIKASIIIGLIFIIAILIEVIFRKRATKQSHVSTIQTHSFSNYYPSSSV